MHLPFVLSLSNKTPASKTFQSVSQSGTLVLGYTQRPIAASKTCCCSSNAHYCSCKQKLLGFVASWLLSSFDETSLLLLRRQLTGWAFSLQCCSAASFSSSPSIQMVRRSAGIRTTALSLVKLLFLNLLLISSFSFPDAAFPLTGSHSAHRWIRNPTVFSRRSPGFVTDFGRRVQATTRTKRKLLFTDVTRK